MQQIGVSKKSIICIILAVCFVFSAVLFCYADNIRVNGNNEKKDFSLFSGAKAECYICPPTDRLSEVSNDKSCGLPYASVGCAVLDLAQANMFKMRRTVSEGKAVSHEIVVNTYKKDGKK